MEIFIKKYLKEVNQILMVLNMSGKRVFLLFSSLVFLMSLFANAGFASQHETGTGNFLDNIFEPFAGINLAATYDKAPNFIDALFYFLFFIGIAQFTLRKQFEGKGGTAVIIAFGLALALGLAIWTSRIGFRLGDRIGPIAGALFAIIFFVFIVKMLKGDQEGLVGPSFWIGYAAAFIFINFLVPEVFTVFNETKWGSVAIAILNFLFFISIFFGIPSYLSKHFGSGRRDAEPEGRGWRGLFGGRDDREREELGERRETARDRERGREEERLEHLDRNIDQFEERLRQRLEATENDEIVRLREIARLIVELDDLQRQLGFRR